MSVVVKPESFAKTRIRSIILNGKHIVSSICNIQSCDDYKVSCLILKFLVLFVIITSVISGVTTICVVAILTYSVEVKYRVLLNRS